MAPDTEVRRRKSGPGDGTEISRRGFLGRLWVWLGGLLLLEYLWIAFDFVTADRNQQARKEKGVVVAGSLERFAPNSVTAFPQGKFYLARLENGGFLALSRSCTHLGCTVPWSEKEGRFVCPCHASSFDIRGTVLGPPASRPLDLYPVRIENGMVKVDIRSPVRRGSFDPSQVVWP